MDDVKNIIITLLSGYAFILLTILKNYRKEIKELKKVVYEIRDDVLILKTRRKNE